MRLQVKGKNVEVSPSIREYAERKLGKLEKQLARGDPGRGRARPSSATRRLPRSHVAEATIFTKGPTLRAREGVDRHARRRSTSSSTSSSAR